MGKILKIGASASIIAGIAAPLPLASAQQSAAHGAVGKQAHKTPAKKQQGKKVNIDRGDGKANATVNLTKQDPILGQEVWAGTLPDDPNSVVVQASSAQGGTLTSVSGKHGAYKLADRAGKKTKDRGIKQLLSKDDAVEAGKSFSDPRAAFTQAQKTMAALVGTSQNSVAAKSYPDPTMSSPVIIDVIYSYTQAAQNKIGTAADVTDRVVLMAGGINYIAKASNAPFKIHVPAVVKATGNEPLKKQSNGAYRTTITSALDALRNPNDGVFDNVQKEKIRYGADLIQGIVETSDSGYCGLGDVGNKHANSSTNWVSVVQSSCTKDASAAAHEFGHNLGINHDRYADGATNRDYYAYNYGYIDFVGKFRDIMSYEQPCTARGITCTLVQRYSNSQMTFAGRPFGLPSSKPLAADAVRTIKETAGPISRIKKYTGVPFAKDFSPNAGATNVVATATPKVYFTGPVKNVSGNTFKLYDVTTGAQIPATVTYDAAKRLATLKPVKSLVSRHKFKAVLTSGIQSTGTSAPLAQQEWNFITGPGPAVSATYPKAGATGVSASVHPSITFNNSVMWGMGYVTLRDANGIIVPVSYVVDSPTWETTGFKQLTLKPKAALRAGSKYSITVPENLYDKVGNNVAGTKTFSFTTK